MSLITPAKFGDLLPRKPYASNDLDAGLRICGRERALGMVYLQANHPHARRFLPFDIDLPGAVFAWQDANLPSPNFIAENTANGHAHAIYALADPVLCHDAARAGPLYWLADIEAGYRRRLGADPSYGGLIVKNPVHPQWRTHWLRQQPYDLAELDGWLWPEDKRRPPRIGFEAGLGRNVSIFEATRKFAYRETLAIKRLGGTKGQLFIEVLAAAQATNAQFTYPLLERELMAITRSVTKFAWRTFTVERFSQIQGFKAQLGNKKRGDATRAKLAELANLKDLSAADIAKALGCTKRHAKRLRASHAA